MAEDETEQSKSGKSNRRGADFVYAGFDGPRFTQLPDDVVDVLMPKLSEAELKVLLYIVRRTFGWKKNADAISLSQMVDGITTRDGRVIDRGTGLSKSSVRRGIAGLEEKKIITVNKIMSADGDYETNVYALKFKENQDEQGVVSDSNYPAEEVVLERNYPGLNLERPVVLEQNTQQTLQETSKRETDRIFDISMGPARKRKFSEAREELSQFVIDFAREFGDEAPTSSSLTRMVNLYIRSGLSMDDFVGLIYDARQATKEHTQSVTKRVGDGPLAKKNQMPYFFRVIENLVDEDQASNQ